MNLTQFQGTRRGAVGFVGPVMNGFSDGIFGETFPVHRNPSGSRQSPSAVAEDLSYPHDGEDGVRLKDATDLADETTYGTCEAVHDREGRGYNTHVIAAGPAGENGVRFACLLHNYRARCVRQDRQDPRKEAPRVHR